MSFIAKILKAIGSLGSGANVACLRGWLDEPQMPKSMIER